MTDVRHSSRHFYFFLNSGLTKTPKFLGTPFALSSPAQPCGRVSQNAEHSVIHKFTSRGKTLFIGTQIYFLRFFHKNTKNTLIGQRKLFIIGEILHFERLYYRIDDNIQRITTRRPICSLILSKTFLHLFRFF